MSRRGGRRSPTGGDQEQRLVAWEALALLGALATLLAGACHGKQAGPPPVCGDGLREGAEACDGTDLGGATCASEGYVTGTLACTSECTLDRGGCAGRCGDGIAQPDEACDGRDLRGVACEALGYVGGELTCTPWCLRSEAACHLCGNGRVDPGEQCDGDNLGGLTCELLTDGVMHGELRCKSDCILHVGGCDPPPTCGNGVKDAGEQCDGQDLGGMTCALFFPDLFEEGTLACQQNCLLDASGCTPPSSCGNGVAEPELGEQCDQGDLAGATCGTLGFERGLLFCGENCVYDVTHCGPSVTWGNGIREQMEACDGDDLQGQTCQDFGFEGGLLACSSECRLDLGDCNHCGDGRRGVDEECEGADVGVVTCAMLGFHAGTPRCHPDCTLDLGPCAASGRCGDGVRQPEYGEECDGGDLDQATCGDLGYYGASLACGADCRFDRAPCEPFGWCGDGIRQADHGEACDGDDLAAATCVTLGFQPGHIRCGGQCQFNTALCASCGDGRCQLGELVSCPEDCSLPRVAAGQRHTCGVRGDGTVWCWGYNTYGQLGSGGSDSIALAPAQVLLADGTSVLEGVVSVALGRDHSCALRADSTVFCWGRNQSRLGIGPGLTSYLAQQVRGVEGVGILEQVTGISSNIGDPSPELGGDHTCALLADTRTSDVERGGAAAGEREPSCVRRSR